MGRLHNQEILTAIDIGTTKICVLIAQKVGLESVKIIGIGKAPSHGLQRGVVADISKTIQSIKTAVQEAELMAGLSVDQAVIGISGAHIYSINAQGAIPIKGGSIHASDVANVLEAAKAIPVPQGQQILHVLPQYFVIDGSDKVHDPLGMHGIRLEVNAHIILGAVASVQNLVSCCQKIGLRVTDVILEQLASADAVLSDDERTLGVGLLDIGGGTTDFVVYQQGSIRHTMVLPVAGNHFTNDLAIGLRTTIADAEQIKKEYGAVFLKAQEPQCMEVEQVHGVHRQVINQSDVVAIVRPRADELLCLIHEEIFRFNLTACMATGMVITGGGSLLAGIAQRAEELFGIPVRLGTVRSEFDIPQVLTSPQHATGYGLLVHTIKKYNQEGKLQEGSYAKHVLERMKSWVVDFF